MLTLHTETFGYTEVAPPLLVRSETLYGTGQLPKFADNLYHDAEEDLWMLPTAEVPLTNLHAGEILEGERLPLRYTASPNVPTRIEKPGGERTLGLRLSLCGYRWGA